MTKALVIGASGGIGQAVVAHLEGQGVEVTALSRRADGLDVTDEASILHHLSLVSGPFDLIFVATGALEIAGAVPEKTIRSLTTEAMTAQFQLNCVGPALVLKHAMALLSKDRPSVFAVLSARVGSIGDNALGGWYSYRTAKAALNQVIRTGSIELARTHKLATCVALHPGTVATQFTEQYLGRHPAVSAEEAAENLISVLSRLGPADSGKFFDWAGKEVPW